LLVSSFTSIKLLAGDPAVVKRICCVTWLDLTISFLNDSIAAPVSLFVWLFSIKSIGTQFRQQFPLFISSPV